MNTYFALIEKLPDYRLVVADDDTDLRQTIDALAFKIISPEEAVGAYNTHDATSRVFLLDSSIALKGDVRGVLDWMNELKLKTNLDSGSALVMYSGEPFAYEAFHRSYAKSNNLRLDIEEIIRFLEDRLPLKKWPDKLPNIQADLSKVIHHLQNLILPIALDAETLKELPRSPSQITIAEVFSDHFAPSASAYLGSQSQQHEGSDILRHIDAICESLEPDDRLVVKCKITAITAAVNSARHTFEKSTGSPPNSTVLPSVNDLQTHLQEIAVAGNALVQALRGIRKEKQGDAK